MAFNTIRHNDILILEINIPRTSIYLANDFKEIIFNSIDKGEKNIIVDFTNCEFVDSTFLGVLVIAYKKLIPLAGNIHLVVSNPNILLSLDTTRMSKIFKIFSTIEEASKDLLTNT